MLCTYRVHFPPLARIRFRVWSYGWSSVGAIFRPLVILYAAISC